MFWIFSSIRRFERSAARIGQKIGLKFEPTCEGEFTVRVPVGRGHIVQFQFQDRFVHIVGYPELEFHPRDFPAKLAAQLLVRNGQTRSGAWQVVADSRSVICRFCYVLPMRLFTVGYVKKAMEATLREVIHADRNFRRLQAS